MRLQDKIRRTLFVILLITLIITIGISLWGVWRQTILTELKLLENETDFLEGRVESADDVKEMSECFQIAIMQYDSAGHMMHMHAPWDLQKASLENGADLISASMDHIGSYVENQGLFRYVLWYAQKSDDGSVLRVGKQIDFFREYSLSAAYICSLYAVLFTAALLWSSVCSRRITYPFRKFAEDLSSPVDEAYEELRPYLRQIQEQQIKISRELENKKLYAAHLSHELKTPMTSILGYSSVLVKELEEDIYRDFAARIEKNALQVQKIMNAVVNLSEVESKEGEMTERQVSLLECTKHAIEELRPFAEQRGVKLVIRGEESMVKGEEDCLVLMVKNLAENAIRYSNPGDTVLIEAADRLSVTDEGIGIPESDLPRIFERFYCVDREESKKRGGTGLGLSIVAEIAKHFGYQLNVISEINKGTKITVVFPKS